MRGGASTFSGSTPTVEVTNGRPMACASAAARPASGGASGATTTTSAAPSAAGMSAQWPTKRQSVSMPCVCACRRTLRA